MYFQGVLGYDHTNHSKSLSQYDAEASEKVQWHTCEGERWKTQFLYLESTMLAQWRLITSTVNRLFTRTFWAPRDVLVEGDVSDATPENCFWDGQLSLWSIWRVWTLPRRASHISGSSDCHCSVSQAQTYIKVIVSNSLQSKQWLLPVKLFCLHLLEIFCLSKVGGKSISLELKASARTRVNSGLFGK